MSELKKKAVPKKSEPKPKKEAPKKEEPKKEHPKKEHPKKEAPKKVVHTSFASLKKAYFAALKAHPADATALRTQYKKARVALRKTLKSKK